MRVILFLVVVSITVFGFSQTDKFQAANALYNDGKYAEAVDAYQAILDTNVHSAELYYNLANAHYKMNHVAPSIYYFEKALQLSPNDKDIKNNLAFAQNMTIDAIEKVPQVGFSRIFNNIINITTADNWAIFAVIGCMAFVVLFLLYNMSYKTSVKRLAFITSVLSLFFGCFSVFMAYQKDHLVKKDNPAIVFNQESRVKTDPNKTSEELFRLHEGTKVQALETYEDWTKIQLSDNSTGWVPSSDIKLLNIF